MITDVYGGSYTIDADGVTVLVTGLANVDTSSAYTTPGLWSYIDAATGDCTLIIDPEHFTYTPEAGEAPAMGAPEGEAPQGEGTAYLYEFDGIAGKETMEIDLLPDGTCRLSLPGNPVLTDVYAGTYTREGDTVTITGLTNVDASSSYTTPGLWDWIVDGNTVITVDDGAGAFTPAQ